MRRCVALGGNAKGFSAYARSGRLATNEKPRGGRPAFSRQSGIGGRSLGGLRGEFLRISLYCPAVWTNLPPDSGETPGHSRQSNPCNPKKTFRISRPAGQWG